MAKTTKKGASKKAPAEPAADLGASEAPVEPKVETPEEAQERLEKEIDAEVATPADKAAVAPAENSEVVEKKGVKVLTPAPMRYVAVGVEVYNPKGVLVGTEANENVAGRKAERFNDLHRQHKLTV